MQRIYDSMTCVLKTSAHHVTRSDNVCLSDCIFHNTCSSTSDARVFQAQATHFANVSGIQCIVLRIADVFVFFHNTRGLTSDCKVFQAQATPFSNVSGIQCVVLRIANVFVFFHNVRGPTSDERVF